MGFLCFLKWYCLKLVLCHLLFVVDPLTDLESSCFHISMRNSELLVKHKLEGHSAHGKMTTQKC